MYDFVVVVKPSITNTSHSLKDAQQLCHGFFKYDHIGVENEEGSLKRFQPGSALHAGHCKRYEFAMCTADLTLAITAGAHFDDTATSESSSQLEAEMFSPTPGVAVQVATIEMSRAELEQLASEMFVPTSTPTAPPSASRARPASIRPTRVRQRARLALLEATAQRGRWRPRCAPWAATRGRAATMRLPTVSPARPARTV